MLCPAFTLTVTIPVTTLLLPGLVIATVGGVVSAGGGVPPPTLTTTAVELVALPAASEARATSEALLPASAVESQLKAYGALLSLASSVPLTRRSTRVTPTLSLAVTLIGAMPVTVPRVGDVIATEGGWTSAALACAAATTAAPALT